MENDKLSMSKTNLKVELDINLVEDWGMENDTSIPDSVKIKYIHEKIHPPRV